MAFQADYGKGMELNKPADPFQQRLQQSAPSGPPPVNPASFRSNPFAKMGGMGARAAMAQGAPQGQPPPQAPAYGMRERLAGMAGRMEGMGGRGGGSPYNPNAPSPDMQRRMDEQRSRDAMRYGDEERYRRGGAEAFRGASLTPPPTGMPGGIMGERPRMDQFRQFGQGGGFGPLRARLMAQRGGGMPPQAPQLPQAQGNPFFDRMLQAPPQMGRPGPPIMQEDYPMSEPVYY